MSVLSVVLSSCYIKLVDVVMIWRIEMWLVSGSLVRKDTLQFIFEQFDLTRAFMRYECQL